MKMTKQDVTAVVGVLRRSIIHLPHLEQTNTQLRWRIALVANGIDLKTKRPKRKDYRIELRLYPKNPRFDPVLRIDYEQLKIIKEQAKMGIRYVAQSHTEDSVINDCYAAHDTLKMNLQFYEGALLVVIN